MSRGGKYMIVQQEKTRIETSSVNVKSFGLLKKCY